MRGDAPDSLADSAEGRRADTPLWSTGKAPASTLGLRLLVGGLLATVLVLLVHPMARIPVRASLNHNEGWNAYHARAAMEGAALYPPAESLVSNNYPPLSFFIVGAIGALTGDVIIAGRLLSLLALFCVAALVALLVHHATRAVAASTFAALLFLAYCLIHFDMYVAMNDPGWLAHGLMLAAFLFLIKGKGRTSAAAAGILSAATLFVKHSVLPLPAAIGLWAIATRGPRARVWLAGVAVTTGGLFAACHWVWGVGFWAGVFGTPRDVSVWYLAAKLQEFYTPMVPLGAAVLLAHGGPQHVQDAATIWVYLVVSIVWSLAMLAGDGVVYNAVFDVLIASTLLAGIVVGRRAEATTTRRLAVAAVLALAVAPSVPAALLRSYGQMLALETVSGESEKAIATLAAAPAPVACETLALCFWAGQPMAIDFFITGQKIKTAALSVEALECPLGRGDFTLIELTSPGSQYAGFPKRVNDAMARLYRPVFVTPRRVLLAPSARLESATCEGHVLR